MDTSSIRILIVDDNPQVRENLAAVLNLACGNAAPQLEIVGQAGDGLEGIKLSQMLQPDVILMDLEMPILNGYEATRWIKTHQPASRVIILSIHTGSSERERARAVGADSLVVKGDSYQILLNAILGRDGSSHSPDIKEGERT